MNKIQTFLLSLFLLVMGASNSFAAEILNDNLVDTTLKDKNLQKPPVNKHYNYASTRRIPIRLAIIADIKSEKDITEGQTVVFRALNDIWHNRQKKKKKDDLVQAKVETIIKSGMNGIPASIIFGDFKFDNIESSRVLDEYEKFGQDRSLWVYPMKWALTILPPSGSLTNFIKGGHAKLKTNEVIELYYYPDWN